MWQGENLTEARGRFLSHWVVALPVLLVVAALSMRQINLYPPTADEFFSMFNSGWLVNSPYSPLEVVESLHTFSPNHTPGYFVLLNIWGNVIFIRSGHRSRLGRVLWLACHRRHISTGARFRSANRRFRRHHHPG